MESLSFWTKKVPWESPRCSGKIRKDGKRWRERDKIRTIKVLERTGKADRHLKALRWSPAWKEINATLHGAGRNNHYRKIRNKGHRTDLG